MKIMVNTISFIHGLLMSLLNKKDNFVISGQDPKTDLCFNLLI